MGRSLVIVGLKEAASVFSDWLSFRSRLADLGVRSSFALWVARTDLSAVESAATVAIVTILLVIAGLSDPRTIHISSLETTFLVLLFVPGLMYLWPVFCSIVWNPLARQIEEASEYTLSRGELLNEIRAWFAKAGFTGFAGRPIYVIPDDFRAWTGLAPVGVVLRCRYLDWMSRAEIQALAARQFTRQDVRFSGLILRPVLAYALAAVGLLVWLHIGLRGWLVAFPFLLGAEIAVLAVCSPYFLLRADLRAIRLTGNAESFLSAVAASSRLNGDVPNLALLGKIAQAAGVPSERLRTLIEERDLQPEDRYPTSGDYLTTGLA